VCTGGWMYEAYEYTKENGILLRGEYAPYHADQGSCKANNGKYHFKNLGFDEKD